MIYSFHHTYTWLRGGIESGIAYRAKLFRSMGLDARFVFATTFPDVNIQHEINRLGFFNSEVLWLYGFFTDCKISSVIYTLEQLEQSFGENGYTCFRNGTNARYVFSRENRYYDVYLEDDVTDHVYRVCMISNGCLLRQDYYTYCKVYSEYYFPFEGYAQLYLRRFFNEDGTIAYEEIPDRDQVIYRFKDRVLYSREELVSYMISQLNLTRNDIVLIDGEYGMIDQSAFIGNAFPAKVGLIIHINHYLEENENHILWAKCYEYAFTHPEKIDFYVTSTEAQSALLRKQFVKYKGIEPLVVSIPVFGIEQLRIPSKKRKKSSLITAGRLMNDKRVEWIIEAVVIAKQEIQDLSLDIYGDEVNTKIRKKIDKLNCGEYVHLCGFQKLDEIYQNYEAYISASWGESFGITFLEAMASGLPLLAFDLPYGAQAFIENGINGYKIEKISIEGLANGIVHLFSENLKVFQQHSYEKVKEFSTEKVGKRWKEVLEQLENI